MVPQITTALNNIHDKLCIGKPVVYSNIFYTPFGMNDIFETVKDTLQKTLYHEWISDKNR